MAKFLCVMCGGRADFRRNLEPVCIPCSKYLESRLQRPPSHTIPVYKILAAQAGVPAQKRKVLNEPCDRCGSTRCICGGDTDAELRTFFLG